jgi:predicted RNase H-like HicB family nuclease
MSLSRQLVYSLVLHLLSTGEILATIPLLPHYREQSKTRKAALKKARAALGRHLADLIDRGVPLPKSDGVVEVRAVAATVDAKAPHRRR